MRITNVRAIPLIRALGEPYLGGTYRLTSRNTIVTEIWTDAGVVGQSFGGDEEKYQMDIVRVIEERFKPLLIGEDPRDVERLWDKMFHTDPGLDVRGILYMDLTSKGVVMQAIAAVDMALWDAIGKTLNTPVYKLLGGFRDRVPVIAIGGYYRQGKGDRELKEEVKAYKDMGLAGMKLKVGRKNLKEDACRVRLVRETVGEDFVIVCDANMAWSADEAIAFSRMVEDLNVRWLEEPVHWYDQLQGLRHVRRHSRIPVAAGQGEISRFGCRDLILGECVDIINVDVTIAGGITEWRKVAAMASMFNVEMAHHEEPQVAIHLLASIRHGLFVEIFPDPERDPMWFDLPVQQPEIREGYMRVPEGPGLGIDLNPEVVLKFAPESSVSPA